MKKKLMFRFIINSKTTKNWDYAFVMYNLCCGIKLIYLVWEKREEKKIVYKMYFYVMLEKENYEVLLYGAEFN